MTFVATTLTEHLLHEGEKRGEARGRKQGEKYGEERGTIKGAMNKLQEFHDFGLIPENIYQTQMASLKQEWDALERETSGEDHTDDKDGGA